MKEIGTFDIENSAVSSNKEKFTCTLKFAISIYMCKIIIFIDNFAIVEWKPENVNGWFKI